MTRSRLVRHIKDHVNTWVRPGNLLVDPELVEKPEGEKVLVLSTHFDDEAIGCGGTIRKHVLAGNQVAVVYLTDGREGNPGAEDQDEVARKRKAESKKAAAILGVGETFYLDQPETKFKPTRELVEQTAELIQKVGPDILYIPSFLDNHIDHFETNRLLLKVSGTIKEDVTVAAYEVWTPLVPNVLVDITRVASVKEEAIRAYESQVAQVDYVSSTLALNRYRSAVHLKGAGYAEAFLLMSMEDYVGLMKKLGLEKRWFVNRP